MRRALLAAAVLSLGLSTLFPFGPHALTHAFDRPHVHEPEVFGHDDDHDDHDHDRGAGEHHEHDLQPSLSERVAASAVQAPVPAEDAIILELPSAVVAKARQETGGVQGPDPPSPVRRLLLSRQSLDKAPPA